MDATCSHVGCLPQSPLQPSERTMEIGHNKLPYILYEILSLSVGRVRKSFLDPSLTRKTLWYAGMQWMISMTPNEKSPSNEAVPNFTDFTVQFIMEISQILYITGSAGNKSARKVSQTACYWLGAWGRLGYILYLAQCNSISHCLILRANVSELNCDSKKVRTSYAFTK